MQLAKISFQKPLMFMVPKKPFGSLASSLTTNRITTWNALLLLPFLILSNEHQKQLNCQQLPNSGFPPLATASPCRLTTHSLRGLAPERLSAQTPLTMRKEKLRPPQSFGGQRHRAASVLPSPPHPVPAPCFPSPACVPSPGVSAACATPRTVARPAPLPRVLQARTLGWVAVPSCRGSSQPRAGTRVSLYAPCIGRRLLYH